MRKYMLTGVAAALMLAAIAGSAAARNLEVSSQTFRSTWARLTFTNPARVTTSCDVTMEGSFHSRTIAKVINTLMGYITRADLANCRAPSLTLELPWHIQYAGFSGILPNITDIQINLVGTAFLIDFGAAGRCLYKSTATRPTRGIINLGAGGVITSIRSDELARVPLLLRLGGLACPAEGELVGRTTTVTVLNSTTEIFVTLI